MRGKRVDADRPRTRSLFATPAVRALLFQMLALVLVVPLAILISAFAGVDVPILAAATGQGGLAALLSRRVLAPWWMIIQFLFPVGAVALNSLQLPPMVFLLAFIFFVILFWSTFRTQVPYYPSHGAVWRAVSGLLPEGRAIRFIDIGSGFGGLVLHLAAQHRDSEFIGIELAPLPWMSSYLRARIGGRRGRFIHGDYHALDFAQFDVVFAYLSPAAMPTLWRKACAEMRPGTLLLSYEFPIPGTEPQLAVQCGRQGEFLYGWRF
jgi:hypothetical protein